MQLSLHKLGIGLAIVNDSEFLLRVFYCHIISRARARMGIYCVQCRWLAFHCMFHGVKSFMKHNTHKRISAAANWLKIGYSF